MQVTVRPFGIVRTALGQTEFRVSLSDGSVVRDALDQLVQQCGRESRATLLSADGDGMKVRAVVAGKAVSLDSPLNDGDELSLMLPIGGGA